MSQNKTIRISDETFEKLGKLRQGFETPDDCICRILSCYNEKENSKSNIKRATAIIKRIILEDGTVRELV